MTSRWLTSDVVRGDAYDERFERLARAGHDVHGEASFLMGYEPRSVLDAGCGTGRIARELDRRGVQVVGVDIDRSMLETAVEKSPEVEWFRADLSSFSLADLDDPESIRQFDVVVAAGNVMIFLAPGSENHVIQSMAEHLTSGGLLVAGFQLRAGEYGVREYDEGCAAAGLTLVERFSSWSRDPWSLESGYAVSVHQGPQIEEPAAS